jgi:serpin B
MMHQTEGFQYYDTGDLKILQMSYLGREFAMTILLPSDVDGLAALEEQISTKTLDRWLAKLRPQSVSVALPKFTIDPSQSIELVPVLGEMGTRLAFDPNAADLTMIANPPDAADRLFLDQVRHKAFVKVDEKGTEAAAATSTGLTELAPMPPTSPKQFRADHPFLFLIRDIQSEMILFVGRVADPRS